MVNSNRPESKKSSKFTQTFSGGALVPSVVVALATWISFIPVLQNGFVDWDDHEMLVDNPFYRGLAWPQLRWMFTTFHMGHFQPLSWLTFALDYLIWGTNPVGYHLTNLVLHTANAALFFFLARLLLSKAFRPTAGEEFLGLNLAAGLAALAFSMHPLRVESVAWATERRDVLSGLFFLLTLYGYVQSRVALEAPLRRRWFVLSLIAYLLSLTAKAAGITLPAVLLLLDLYPLRRLSGGWRSWFPADGWKILWEKLPFAVLAVPFAVVALLAQESAGALRPVQQYFLSYRIGQAAYGMIFYLWKTILPFQLSPLYELPYDFAAWGTIFVLCGIAAAGITAALVLLKQRWPAGLACWVYYLVMLAPVLGVAQSGPQLVADRYSYLSCLSWAVLLGGGFFSIGLSVRSRSGRSRALFATSAATVLLVLALGAATWKQTGVWRNTRTLWEHVIAVGPASSVAHYNLGRVFEDDSRADQARDYYQRALNINPTNADAHYNLARLLARQGLHADAIRHYRQALSARPHDADAHNNLGLSLALTGEVEASLEEFDRATRIDPAYAKGFFNRGRVLATQGQWEKAAQSFRQALKIEPDKVEILLGLSDVLIRQGLPEEAIAHLQKAVALKPDLADGHTALARALSAQGRPNEAEKHYREALRLLQSQRQAPPS